MASHRLSSRIPTVLLLVALAGLAACSAATGTPGTLANTQNDTPTPPPTATPASAPTLVPADCDARYSADYEATIPDTGFPQTDVYGQIVLPPQTRYYRDDASGHRFKFMCSAGTTDSVLNFMTQHLTQLGWQKVDDSQATNCQQDPNYPQHQCWVNGKYGLFMGIKSNADWLINFLDPAAISTSTLVPADCDARYSGDYEATIPNTGYTETNVYAQIVLPPGTRYYRDGASGHRYKYMCSAGTTDSVMNFMTQHLQQLGWQLDANTCEQIPGYGHEQCWKNGKYTLSFGIKSNTDWYLAFLDPAFLQ